MSMKRKTFRNLVVNEPSLLPVDRGFFRDSGLEVAGNGEAVAVVLRGFCHSVGEGYGAECVTDGSAKVMGGCDIGAPSRLFEAAGGSEEDTAVPLRGDEVSKDVDVVDGVGSVGLRSVCPLGRFGG